MPPEKQEKQAPARDERDLSEEQLTELEALLEAATPPPWRQVSDGSVVQTQHITRDVWTIPHREEDLPLICLGRNALPSLIAEVRRSRAARDKRLIEALRTSKFETYCPDCGWTVRCAALTAGCDTCAPVRAALRAAPTPTQAPVRCNTHDAALRNEAFFACGCRYYPPLGFAAAAENSKSSASDGSVAAPNKRPDELQTAETRSDNRTAARADAALFRNALSWMKAALASLSKPQPPGPPSYPTRHDAELLQRFEAFVVAQNAHMSAAAPDHARADAVREALCEVRYWFAANAMPIRSAREAILDRIDRALAASPEGTPTETAEQLPKGDKP